VLLPSLGEEGIDAEGLGVTPEATAWVRADDEDHRRHLMMADGERVPRTRQCAQ
jgi:hypothetical protein